MSIWWSMTSWVLYLAHNTYWGRSWGKAPRNKIVAGSESLVGPQRCQCLCVTPRQSWGSHPQPCQARQANLRYFRQNKPKKQRKTHSRPQEPNPASTGKTSPCLTLCFPLTHTHKSSQLKSPVFGSWGCPDADPEHSSVAQLRRNVGSCRDWAQTHTQCLCTCRHRCDPFWGEKLVSERSRTAVGAEVMPSAPCPLWTNPFTS